MSGQGVMSRGGREVSRGVPRVSCRQANVSHIQRRCPPGCPWTGHCLGVDEQEDEHALKMNSTAVCCIDCSYIELFLRNNLAWHEFFECLKNSQNFSFLYQVNISSVNGKPKCCLS